MASTGTFRNSRNYPAMSGAPPEAVVTSAQQSVIYEYTA